MPNAYLISQRGVNALKDLLRGRPAATAPGFAPATVSPDEYAPPFTVRWAQSEDQGNGKWVIWFPAATPAAGNSLLMIGRRYVPPSGLTPATTLPTGWWILPNEASGGDVFLNVVVPNVGTDDPWAYFDDEPIADSGVISGYLAYPIQVAKARTGTGGGKRVLQFVDSFVKIPWNVAGPAGDGGGGGSGDESGYLHPFQVARKNGAWVIWLPDPATMVMHDTDYSQITGIAAAVGLDPGWYTMTAISAGTTSIWLVITFNHTSGAVSVSIASAAGQEQTGYTTWSILIAVASVNAQTGEHAVKQFVESTVHVGEETPENEVDVVTDVEYGQFDDGSGTTDWRIRITKQALSINQTTRQFELGAAEYEFIDTIPISSILPSGS